MVDNISELIDQGLDLDNDSGFSSVCTDGKYGCVGFFAEDFSSSERAAMKAKFQSMESQYGSMGYKCDMADNLDVKSCADRGFTPAERKEHMKIGGMTINVYINMPAGY